MSSKLLNISDYASTSPSWIYRKDESPLVQGYINEKKELVFLQILT